MNIKAYSSEKHGAYLPDVHRPYYTAPSDIENFSGAVKEALDDLDQVIDFDAEFDVVVAETDDSGFEDASKEQYFHGFSFYDGLKGHDGYAVFIRGSTEFESWKGMFKDMLIHEVGHQIFYQRENQDNWEETQYMSLMFEGHAENLASEVNERFGYDWTPSWREKEIEVDKEELLEDLEKPRSLGDEDESNDHDLFLRGGERWSNAEGYTIAYQIVKYLLEENMIALETFINTDTEEWREMVDTAVNQLY